MDLLRCAHISLLQFKNYASARYRFEENLVGICGPNGSGKTNLLDAIHYLCFTRSYFNRSDQAHVQHGTQGFRIQGNMEKSGVLESAVCILREEGRKEFSVDDSPYKKFSEHIGRYPCVVIAPDDVQLITGSSEQRRAFLDSMLSQLDATYLKQLIVYTRVLQHRNSFLKAARDGHQRDLSVLDALDEQLSTAGTYIYQARAGFCKEFLPKVITRYRAIAQKEEPVTLHYDTELGTATLAELLKNTRQRDLVVQRTSAGIHRDDLEFCMAGAPFKTTASQGQRKSLLFALKLAEVDIILEQKGHYPILLLDDVFEKLDEQRIQNLLQTVAAEKDMQVFITDTDCERLQTHLAQTGRPYQVVQPGQ